jgi:hypothetical protein
MNDLLKTLQTVGTPPLTATGRPRNLGWAILLAAITDYQSLDDQQHEDAKQFLYPTTADSQDQYNWAVNLAEGMNPQWMRMLLNRRRWEWNRIRVTGKERRARRLRAS